MTGLSATLDDRRLVPRPVPPRRLNGLGRVVVTLHLRYYRPAFVPVLWIVAVATAVLQVALVAWTR